MNKFFTFVALGAVLVSARTAHARAAFQSSEVMIANSDAIALVQIERVEKVATKGTHWTYGQKATARVERTLKGELPSSIALLGDENFSCARCHFETGRFLVFLKREKEGFAGTNYQLSARKIENAQVNWGAKGAFETKMVPLGEAISNVQATLEAQAKAPHFSLTSDISEENTRIWKIIPEAKAGEARHQMKMNQTELETWLRTLPVGAKVSLEISDVLWKPGQNASRKEIDSLQMFAHAFGLEFRIIPGG